MTDFLTLGVLRISSGLLLMMNKRAINQYLLPCRSKLLPVTKYHSASMGRARELYF